MPYIPKSQYKIKHTNGGELYVMTTGKDYKGEYIQYGTKYFAGNNITNLKTKLKKIDLGSNTIHKSAHTFLYNELKKSYYQKSKNQAKPPSSSPQPMEINYKNGVWERYFCQRRNNINIIFELEKKVFDDLFKGKYNPSLYKFDKIEWSLINPDFNIDRILKFKKEYPNIDILFNNPLEYIK